MIVLFSLFKKNCHVQKLDKKDANPPFSHNLQQATSDNATELHDFAIFLMQAQKKNVRNKINE